MSTETYTTIAAQTITVRTRKDGRMDKRTVATIIADLDARIAANDATLAEYDALYSGEVEGLDDFDREAISARWNDLHDYATELVSYRHEVELNRAPIAWGTTAWLASQNID